VARVVAGVNRPEQCVVLEPPAFGVHVGAHRRGIGGIGRPALGEKDLEQRAQDGRLQLADVVMVDDRRTANLLEPRPLTGVER
jgi:hypothetical protein